MAPPRPLRSLVAVPLVFVLATPAVAAPPESAAPTQPVAEPQAQAVPLPAYDSPLQPQPIPPPSPGRKQDPNRGLGLMIPGLAIFVASFGASLFGGALMGGEFGRPMMIPLAGPFISIGRADNGSGVALSAALGACQIVGLGMAIGGGVWWHRDRKRRAQLSFAPTGLRIRF